jgi:hypothetical protein
LGKPSFGEFGLLSLEALISSSEAVGRDKDLSALKQLYGIPEKLRMKPK